VVPVSDAHKLERLLTAKHVPFEMKIYEGQGHNLTQTASQDAGERAVKFLDAHLKPAS
jgi:dipeptidyl aminopeptidase/acylaminoacyl peptidase